MSMSATYSAHENKCRLYSTARLDQETYDRVKALGFRWAPKQECFIAPAWNPAREDLLLDLCGEIDDEDITLEERAAERAERFDEYADKRSTEAEAAHTEVDRIAGGIPFGQPILVGHHSERRARKDAQRIQDGMRKAVNLWETSKYWERRAAAAVNHAKYKERPDVRARRIKTLEAEQRKVTRTQDESRAQLALWTKDGLTHERAVFITNHSTGYESFCFPLADYPREAPASQYEGGMSLWSALTGQVITYEQARDLAVPMYERSLEHCRRWLDHLANRLAYERAMLHDAGGTIADQHRPEVGGACRCWVYRAGWAYIKKVNKVSVTVEDNWGNGGQNFTRTVPFDQLKGILSRNLVEQYKAEGRVIDNDNGAGFFLKAGTELPDTAPEPVPAQPEPAKPDAYEAMQAQLKAGVQVAVVDELFPTPGELADQMVCLADIQPGERVLEPSAGTGKILDAICRVPDFVTHPQSYVHVIEKNEALALALAKRRDPGRWNYTQDDFLYQSPDDWERFDVVVMNPPFQDQYRHVTHALSFLRPGGRLVAVMSSGVTFHTSEEATAFRALIESYGGSIEALPPDTFKASGTGVQTVLVSVALPPMPEPEPIPEATPEPEPEPEPEPVTMAALADTIQAQATTTQAKLARERLEQAWLSKKAPTKPQAEPCGLFAQTQGAFL